MQRAARANRPTSLWPWPASIPQMWLHFCLKTRVLSTKWRSLRGRRPSKAKLANQTSGSSSETGWVRRLLKVLNLRKSRRNKIIIPWTRWESTLNHYWPIRWNCRKSMRALEPTEANSNRSSRASSSTFSRSNIPTLSSSWIRGCNLKIIKSQLSCLSTILFRIYCSSRWLSRPTICKWRANGNLSLTQASRKCVKFHRYSNWTWWASYLKCSSRWWVKECRRLLCKSRTTWGRWSTVGN